MPRGYHKRWTPGIKPQSADEPKRYINPWPLGSMPQNARHSGEHGKELEATIRLRERVPIADYWAVKGMPFNGRGSKGGGY